jgi:hypothetical protein
MRAARGGRLGEAYGEEVAAVGGVGEDGEGVGVRDGGGDGGKVCGGPVTALNSLLSAPSKEFTIRAREKIKPISSMVSAVDADARASSLSLSLSLSAPLALTPTERILPVCSLDAQNLALLDLAEVQAPLPEVIEDRLTAADDVVLCAFNRRGNLLAGGCRSRRKLVVERRSVIVCPSAPPSSHTLLTPASLPTNRRWHCRGVGL